MKAHSANLINAAALILLGLWGAYATAWAPTAFIPVVGGVILLALQGGVKAENKVVAHIAVVVTLLLIIGLFKPFSSAMADGRQPAMIRVGIMIVTGIMAMIAFVRSFIAARKAREQQG